MISRKLLVIGTIIIATALHLFPMEKPIQGKLLYNRRDIGFSHYLNNGIAQSHQSSQGPFIQPHVILLEQKTHPFHPQTPAVSPRAQLAASQEQPKIVKSANKKRTLSHSVDQLFNYQPQKARKCSVENQISSAPTSSQQREVAASLLSIWSENQENSKPPVAPLRSVGLKPTIVYSLEIDIPLSKENQDS